MSVRCWRVQDEYINIFKNRLRKFCFHHNFKSGWNADIARIWSNNLQCKIMNCVIFQIVSYTGRFIES